MNVEDELHSLICNVMQSRVAYVGVGCRTGQKRLPICVVRTWMKSIHGAQLKLTHSREIQGNPARLFAGALASEIRQDLASDWVQTYCESVWNGRSGGDLLKLETGRINIKMKPLNACCCCVPLRTGALTIAILFLIVNIGVLLGWSGFFFATLANYSHFAELRFSGVMLAALAVLCGINITMDSLLVHGIRRNVRKFILPWVVWYGIFTSLITLTLVGVEIWLLVMYLEAAKHPSDGIGILIGFLIMIGCIAAISLPVMWYWYACVASYYSVLAPSDVYVMESLHDDDAGPEKNTQAYRPVRNAD